MEFLAAVLAVAPSEAAPRPIAFEPLPQTVLTPKVARRRRKRTALVPAAA